MICEPDSSVIFKRYKPLNALKSIDSNDLDWFSIVATVCPNELITCTFATTEAPLT